MLNPRLALDTFTTFSWPGQPYEYVRIALTLQNKQLRLMDMVRDSCRAASSLRHPDQYLT